jgi:Arc/MetJ family transcription regulator
VRLPGVSPAEEMPRYPSKTFLEVCIDSCILVCMRTTLNIDDDLLESARRYTGEVEKTALVRMGLRALIEREAARRLSRLGGSMSKLKIKPRVRAK